MAAMNMNQEQFKQLIREEKPVLVDFWAPWCSYCRRIGPAYEKIGEEYADSLHLHYLPYRSNELCCKVHLLR